MKYRINNAFANEGVTEQTSMPEQTEEIVRFEIEGVMTCPSCGTVGYAGERYCSRCGGPFTPDSSPPLSPRRCPGCGQPVRHPIAFFCSACGKEL